MPKHRHTGRLAAPSLIALAALPATTSVAHAQAEPPKPRIVLSPDWVPADQLSTVTLTARHADGSPVVPGDFNFNWSVSDGSFVAGTGPHHPQPKIQVSGDASIQVELILEPTGGPFAGPGKGEDAIGVQVGDAILMGDATKWHPLELWFAGPQSQMTASSPNPFLDRRLDVTFTRPDGSTLSVPGFYDGDGRGGSEGNTWKARLTPDQVGSWSFSASFRGGTAVAVAASPLAGSPLSFNGASGSFTVAPRDPYAPGFLRDGRLADVGEHYRKQVDGGYWIKSGTDSPENLLGFAGFAGIEKAAGSKGLLHRYEPHAGDWTLADPELPLAGDDGGDPSVSRNLFGALNYLSSVGVNSVYFLPMNLGGDGQDASPFVGHSGSGYANTHYHVTRLHQWERVFRHAQERGIQLLMVLAETEPANEQWLDGGQLGTERKLFFRELVARFAHHNAVKWTLSEENDFAPSLVKSMATHLAGLDAYDHGIAVHNKPYNEQTLYNPLLGDPNFTATAIQYNPAAAGQTVEYWRAQSAAAGRPWVIDMDENNPADTGAGPDNADELRKEALYDIYFSGGQLEWYLGGWAPPIGGDLSVEDFRTREELWLATKYARQLLELLPFHNMQPMDERLYNEPYDYGGGEVFGAPGEAYVVYLPNADADGTIQLDLSGHHGPFDVSWFNPRSGSIVAGSSTSVVGGSWIDLPSAPAPVDEDWVAVVRRPPLWASDQTLSFSQKDVATLELDGTPVLANHAWAFLASASGTSPGTPFGNLTLPLVYDELFAAALTSPSLMGLGAYFGLFDVDGRASTTLSISTLAQPSLVGTTVSFAWIAGQIEPYVVIPFAVSNPVSVTILP